MGWGANRQPVFTDTFTTQISSEWSIGEGALNDVAWNAADGGTVRPVNTSSTSVARFNAKRPRDDQYSSVTMQTLSDSVESYMASRVRIAEAGIASYEFWLLAFGAERYSLEYRDAANSSTVLAHGGTPVTVNAGDVLTFEAEGTALRGGVNADLVGNTTDNTLTGGFWGFGCWAATSQANASITAFTGGEIYNSYTVPFLGSFGRRRQRYAA